MGSQRVGHDLVTNQQQQQQGFFPGMFLYSHGLNQEPFRPIGRLESRHPLESQPWCMGGAHWSVGVKNSPQLGLGSLERSEMLD